MDRPGRRIMTSMRLDDASFRRHGAAYVVVPLVVGLVLVWLAASALAAIPEPGECDRGDCSAPASPEATP